jgi:hypothetical protein
MSRDACSAITPFAVSPGDCFRCEGGPPLECLGQIRTPHELTGAERVETRAFVVLDLESLEQVHPVTRRRRDVDPADRVGEEQAGLRQLEELDGADGEQGQAVDHVEVGDEGVGNVTNVRASSSGRGATPST